MTSVWFYAKMALILSWAHLCLGGISSLARRSEMATAAPLPERITVHQPLTGRPVRSDTAPTYRSVHQAAARGAVRDMRRPHRVDVLSADG